MSEAQLHERICEYLKATYPDVIFTTDMSGVKLTPGLAMKMSKLRSSKGIPDILIFKTTGRVKGENFDTFRYAGLFIEVKAACPYDKKGKLKPQWVYKYKTITGKKCRVGKYAHHAIQKQVHSLLEKEGYCAGFVWSFEQAKEIIDNYIQGKR